MLILLCSGLRRRTSSPTVLWRKRQRKKQCLLEKALRWSEAVNRAIKALPEEDVKPFDGVKEKITALHEYCDIAIVSSANYEAVKEDQPLRPD